jgi:tetratricopeptide (TPR) repeat protein
MKRTIVGCAMVLLGGIILFNHCVGTPEITSAKMAIDQKNYDKAIEQCELAIERNPQNAEAYFVMGQAYGQKKMFREMNNAFIKSLEISEKHAVEIGQHRESYGREALNKGVHYYKQNELDDAIDHFELAADLIDDKLPAYKNLAFTYQLNNQDSLAIITYQKALKYAPDDIETKRFLGILYYQSTEYDKAIEILSEVIAKANPKSQEYSDAIFHIAISYDVMGQSEKAIETYNTALESNPGNNDLLFNMGRLYNLQAKYEEAIATFTKMQTDDDALDFDVNYNIGNAYIGIADSLSKKAMEKDEKGNPVYPEKTIAEFQKGEKENFDKAILYLNKAAEMKPDNALVWRQLGISYIRTGQQDKGEEAFKRFEELEGVQQ